jgi:hypothetical protein
MAQLRQGCRAIEAFTTVQGRETPVNLLTELGKLHGTDLLMFLKKP